MDSPQHTTLPFLLLHGAPLRGDQPPSLPKGTAGAGWRMQEAIVSTPRAPLGPAGEAGSATFPGGTSDPEENSSPSLLGSSVAE